MTQPIALLTDFGVQDAYAGVMKGVICSINPDACIIDISHGVRPQDLLNGSYLLYTSFTFFPKGTIFCVVVDPGVGSKRAALCIKTRNYFFVGPDNGVLWSSVQLESVEKIIVLDNPKFFTPQMSNTFHGRDLFAPVCAHLSLGTEVSAMGTPVEQIRQLDFLAVETDGQGIKLRIVHTDHFGNLVLNLKTRDFLRLSLDYFSITVNKFRIDRMVSFYEEAPSGVPVLIPGSSGFMEVSLRSGSAASLCRSTTGEWALFSFKSKRLS